MKTGKRSWYSLSVLLSGILLITGYSNRQKTELQVIITKSASRPEDYQQGTREFYFNEAGWVHGQSHAEMDVERVEIKLVNDSLMIVPE